MSILNLLSSLEKSPLPKSGKGLLDDRLK